MLFSLRKIKPHIYLLSFDSQYELAMHFLRAQEYFECPNIQFRGKGFKLLDYIDWYSQEHDGVFSYAKDWEGFNVPGRVLNSVYNVSDKSDMTERDVFMAQILQFLSTMENGTYAFYLLGAVNDNVDTINHELAHALWNTNNPYRERQETNLEALRASDEEGWQELRDLVLEEGYCPSVASDEMHAYLSTGMYDKWKKAFTIKAWNKMAKPFVSTFKDFK